MSAGLHREARRSKQERVEWHIQILKRVLDDTYDQPEQKQKD